MDDSQGRLRARPNVTRPTRDSSNGSKSRSTGETPFTNGTVERAADKIKTIDEDLQSANEALRVRTEELEQKNAELRAANINLQKLMNAAETAAILFDRNLRLESYSSRAEKLFGIARSDVGKPLSQLEERLGDPAFLEDANRVQSERVAVEREVRLQRNGAWILVRARPYDGGNGSTQGVVLNVVDITEIGRRHSQLESRMVALEASAAASADRVRELTKELIVAEHAERERIAQVLHDDLQQLLFAFLMRVETLSRTLPKDQAVNLAPATALISRALKVTRSLTAELSPPVSNGDDVAQLLGWLAVRMEEMHNLKVDLRSVGPIHLAADHLRTLVFQLVRELLFNVVKHAGVDSATVSLTSDGDQLVVAVEDEGAGFDPSPERERRPASGGGSGLANACRRLAYLGGRLERRSAPGHGARVTLVVPMSAGSSQ